MFLLKKMNLADCEIESVGVSMDRARVMAYINNNLIGTLCEMKDNFPGENQKWNVVVLDAVEDVHLIHRIFEHPYDLQQIYGRRLYVVHADHNCYNSGHMFWIEDVQEL